VIAVVTYQSAASIRQCLDSILNQSLFSQCEVVVFDNASSDGTVAICREYERHHIKLLLSSENLGFAKAVNRISEHASGQYLMLLNPDAMLLQKEDLANLVAYADAHPEAGMVGSKVIKPNGNEYKPSYRYPEAGKVSVDFSPLPGKIAWVIGASLLLNKVLFDQLGRFDEQLFLYADEVDYALRSRQAGFQVAYLPSVVVEHVGGGSADQLGNYHKKTLKTQSRYYFCYKHYPQAEVTRLIRRDKWRALARYTLTRLYSVKKAAIYKAVYDVAKVTLATKQPLKG